MSQYLLNQQATIYTPEACIGLFAAVYGLSLIHIYGKLLEPVDVSRQDMDQIEDILSLFGTVKQEDIKGMTLVCIQKAGCGSNKKQSE